MDTTVPGGPHILTLPVDIRLSIYEQLRKILPFTLLCVYYAEFSDTRANNGIGTDGSQEWLQFSLSLPAVAAGAPTLLSMCRDGSRACHPYD